MMMHLVFNFVLAVSYACLTSFTPGNFLLGFLGGWLLISILPQIPARDGFPFPPITSGRKYLLLGRNILHFLLHFFYDLTASNILIAWDVWTPRDHFSPELIEVPVNDLSDFQRLFLASRITLTPGTLSVDLTDDKNTLIVHVMYPQPEGQAAALRRPIDILVRDL